MRTLLSVLGSLIAVAGTVPYIIETIRGNTKPRIVTWLTWALLTGVAGAASMSAGQLGAAVFALLGTVATSSVVVAGLRTRAPAWGRSASSAALPSRTRTTRTR